jgi:DNA ligase (NAD+)
MFGEKRAKKVVEALEKSKSVSLPEFLGSLGIKGVGRSLATTLCEHFCDSPNSQLTLKDIFWLQDTQVAGCEGFGPARATDFCSWLQEHREAVEELASFMDFEKGECDMNEDQVFSGETICFTGKSEKPRSEMSKLAEAAGASVSSSVNNSTTILVIADIDSTSSKAIKARWLGVKLISPEEFLELVEN